MSVVIGELVQLGSFFLCSELLPDTGRYSVKQTSPRHNAYPTWAKEFIYAGECTVSTEITEYTTEM